MNVGLTWLSLPALLFSIDLLLLIGYSVVRCHGGGCRRDGRGKGGGMAHSSVPLVHARAYNGQPNGVPSTRGLCVGWGVEGKPNAEQ